MVPSFLFYQTRALSPSSEAATIHSCICSAPAGMKPAVCWRCTHGGTVAGLYITAGTKVALLDDNNELVEVIKARDLANQTDLLFRRNSQTGAVECKTNKSAIELNEELHANN